MKFILALIWMIVMSFSSYTIHISILQIKKIVKEPLAFILETLLVSIWLVALYFFSKLIFTVI